MGYLIAYRHTGADPERLEQLLPAVKGAVENAGHQAYCTYFDEEEFQGNGHGPKEIMDHAFQKIEELGGLFILVDGDEKSEGMLMEAGYCIAKNIGFVVAKRAGVTTYLDKMAERSFEYNDINDLVQKIEGVL
jgi:hypothetical protein